MQEIAHKPTEMHAKSEQISRKNTKEETQTQIICNKNGNHSISV